MKYLSQYQHYETLNHFEYINGRFKEGEGEWEGTEPAGCPAL